MDFKNLEREDMVHLEHEMNVRQLRGHPNMVRDIRSQWQEKYTGEGSRKIADGIKTHFSQPGGTKTIIEIAQFLNVPPLNVVRQLLEKMKISEKVRKQIIRQVVENPRLETSHFINVYGISARIMTDIVQAAYNDDVSNNVSIDINNKRVAESNQALYCKYVFALFDTVYGRERASQKYHYEAQTSPTVPQFKLHHPLKIMGRVINWIDVKHVYGGVCVNIIWADAMKKRYCRLIQALGPGALIVRFGFCQGYLRKFQEWCPQLLLLDGSYLSDEPNDAERF